MLKFMNDDDMRNEMNDKDEDLKKDNVQVFLRPWLFLKQYSWQL